MKSRKWIWFTLLFLLLIVVHSVLFYFYASPNNEKATDRNGLMEETGSFLQQRGEAIFQAHYLQGKIDAYQAVVKAAPESQAAKVQLADAHVALAKLLIESDKMEEAKNSLAAAMQVVPNHAEARLLLQEMP